MEQTLHLEYRLVLCLSLLLCHISVTVADLNSGCPSWGCLPWGSFALSSKVPASINGKVTWSTVIDHVESNDDVVLTEKGCVSYQVNLICPTQNGYVALDPVNGNELWSYKDMDRPFLPVTDIYGDVIGVDRANLVFVENDGTPKNPIPIGVIKPQFGVMIANDSIILLTTTRSDTAQIFTYLPDGIIDAAFSLPGSWERLNGTYVPCSHPIIAGKRAYIVTSFVPDGQNATLNGWKRLFALDLLHQMAPRIKLAWEMAFLPASEYIANVDISKQASLDAFYPPIVSYADGIVYINLPVTHRQHSQHYRSFGSKADTVNSLLFGIRDIGTGAERVFMTPSVYGPLAVFDTYDKPLKDATQDSLDLSASVLWTTPGSPAMIYGYDASNGSLIQMVDAAKLAGLDSGASITSKLSITRQSASSTEDTLVMGISDFKGDAHLVVLKTDPRQNSPRLLWSLQLTSQENLGQSYHDKKGKKHVRTVSKNVRNDGIVKMSVERDDDLKWAIEGQIVNTVQNMPYEREGSEVKEKIKPGLVAMVTENGKGYRKSHIMAVY